MKLKEYVNRIRPEYKECSKTIRVMSYKNIIPLNEIVTEFLNENSQHLVSGRCHVISMMLAEKFPGVIHYVEGFASVKWLDTTINLPVQHSWNKWEDIYFDLTAELVYKQDFDDYIKLTEGDLSKVKNDSCHPLNKDHQFFGFHMLGGLKLW